MSTKNFILKKGKKAFTLVELLVVVLIMSILSTIGLISFKTYMKDARDGDRVASFASIKSGLEFYKFQKGKYPMPDVNKNESKISTGALSINGNIYEYSYLGVIGENVSDYIKLANIPVDPLTKNFYLYGLTKDFKSYQIAGIYEGELALNNAFYKTTYAANAPYVAHVIGNFIPEVIYKTNSGSYLTIAPSLIFDKSGPNILNGTGTLSIVDKKENIPYYPSSYKAKNSLKSINIVKETRGSQAELITLKLPSQSELNLLTGTGLIDYFALNSSYNTGVIIESLGAFNNGNTNYLLIENIAKGNVILPSDVNGQCSGISTNAHYFNGTSNYKLSQASNGTSLIATYTSGTIQENTCQFKCNVGYTWNGTSCIIPNYFSGAGTTGDPYRLFGESSTPGTVSAQNCNYYNINATSLNNGSTRGTGTCGNGSQGCLSDGVYLIDPDGANTFTGTNTKLFINSNTTNGNATFTDSATSKTITRNGDVINSTSQKTFGSSSIYFDGNGDYLSLNDSDDWFFGTGDFTIDMFINPSSVQPNYTTLYSQYSSDYNRIVIDWGESGKLRFTDGTTDYTISSSQTWNIGQWYHIAIVKSSTGLKFYKDGILQNSTNVSTALNIKNVSSPLMIGGQTTYSRYFNGYLQNIRITKGEALWTSNFNPPMSAMNVYCDMTNDSGGWTLVSVGKGDNFADPAMTTTVGTTISPSQPTSSKFSDYQMVSLNGTKTRVLLGNGTKYFVKYGSNAWTINTWVHGTNPAPSCSFDGNSWANGRQYHVGDCCGVLGACNNPIHSIFNTYPWYPDVSGLDGRYGGTLWIK